MKGKLATEYCGLELSCKVMSSPAWYYIGTEDHEGPVSRESGYYKTRKEAEQALATGSFDQRAHP